MTQADEGRKLRILYVATTFPVYSETFLQREARALAAAGVELRILSLHKGESSFEGVAVDRFSKWELLKLLYLLPWVVLRRAEALRSTVREMTLRAPPSALNLFENLLGMGAAIVRSGQTRRFAPDIVHGVWASAPAAFGLVSSALVGAPFSTGAHAYDVFEHGGDWLLRFKLRRAALVHVSTKAAQRRVQSLGAGDRARWIRRGLNVFPVCRPLRPDRSCLRIVCVARLVEKKGFPRQVAIYRRMKERGLCFEAEIIGDGPLEKELRGWIQAAGLEDRVFLRGRLSQDQVMASLQAADLLFHTGVVAASGDRDGLPNVIPEAMASGTLVVASPVSGVVEAIEDEVTGFLRATDAVDAWVDVCVRLQEDDALCERARAGARRWVEECFDASRNTKRLIEELKSIIKV